MSSEQRHKRTRARNNKINVFVCLCGDGNAENKLIQSKHYSASTPIPNDVDGVAAFSRGALVFAMRIQTQKPDT